MHALKYYMYLLAILIYPKCVLATQNSSKLTDTAVSITNKYYKQHFVTLVVSTDKYSGVNDFLIKYRGTVMTTSIANYNGTTRITNDTKQTVLYAYHSEEFEKFLLLMKKYSKFPYLLILVIENTKLGPSNLADFTRIAWQNDLVDMVIVSFNKNEEVTVTTYFPYTGGVCGNYLPVQLNENDTMFPDKVMNLNLCPIRASVNIYPFLGHASRHRLTAENGFTNTLYRHLIHKLNATLHITVLYAYINTDIFKFNGSKTLGFSDLTENKSDFIIPDGLMSDERYLKAQPSHVFMYLDLLWIGPSRRPISNWVKLFIPFLNIITGILCLTIILFGIVLIFIARFKQRERNASAKIWFQIYTLLLGQSANYETKISLLNFLFSLWIWFAFIIATIYQGYLITSLQNLILEPPFKSLQDAVQRVDNYGGNDLAARLYKGTPYERNYRIITPGNHTLYLQRIANGERFLLLIRRDMYHTVRHSIQVLEERISTSFQCIYMRRGWPIAERMNLILYRLIEAGITSKLYKPADDVRKGQTEKEANALDISMIICCLLGTFVMWTVCSIIFVIEIIYYKISKIKNQRSIARQDIETVISN